jgi:hypothetical protein
MTQGDGVGQGIRVAGIKTGRIVIETVAVRNEADHAAEIESADVDPRRLLNEGERHLQDEIKDPLANLKMKRDIRDLNLQGKTRERIKSYQ